MTVHEELCRAIWNSTYRHDTLLPWSEVKAGTLHHKRIVAAAYDVYRVFEGDSRSIASPSVVTPSIVGGKDS